MTSFTHSGSTSEKVVAAWLMQNFVLYLLAYKLRINIAYSNGEIKLWKFQWRHSRIPEVLSKKLSSNEMCGIFILYFLPQIAHRYH